MNVQERLIGEFGTVERTQDGDTPDRLQRLFLVDDDGNLINDISTALSAPGLPEPGTPYSSALSNYICTKRSPRRIQGERGRVEVICDYTLTPSWWYSSTGGRAPYPWELPPVVSGGFGVIAEINMDNAYASAGTNQIKNGNQKYNYIPVADSGEMNAFAFWHTITDARSKPSCPILNTAGMAYHPGYKKQIRALQLSISKNYRGDAWDLGRALEFMGTVNDDEIQIAGVIVFSRCAKMDDIRFEERWTSNGVKYWSVVYQISIVVGDNNLFYNHDLVVLSTGLYELQGTPPDHKHIPIKDSQLRPISTPQPLDRNGAKAMFESGVHGNEYQKWLVHWATDWSILELPTSPSGNLSTSRS